MLTELLAQKTSWMMKLLTVAALAEAATGDGVDCYSVTRRAAVARRRTYRSFRSGRARDRHRPDCVGCRVLAGQHRAFHGMLTYSTLVTLYFLYLGIRGEWVGPLLWPAGVLHAVLTFLLARAWRNTHKEAS